MFFTTRGEMKKLAHNQARTEMLFYSLSNSGNASSCKLAVRILTFSLLVALLSLFSSLTAYTSQVRADQRSESLIEQAKQAYVEGHFLKARTLFSQAISADQQNSDALYGYACSTQALHLYSEAIPAYEKALKLAPNDEQIWEGFINALAWGGVYKGDRRMLEQARDKGLTALASWPDRAGFYRSIWTAVDGLNEAHSFLRSLESLQTRLPQSPVLSIQILELKLRFAQGEKKQQEIDQLKNAIRSDLAAMSQEPISSSALSSPQLYKIANAHRLLGEQDRFQAALDALMKTPQGRLLAENIPLPNWPGMMPLFINRDLKNQNLKERLNKIQQMQKMLAPTWHASHANTRSLLALEFDTFRR